MCAEAEEAPREDGDGRPSGSAATDARAPLEAGELQIGAS